MFYISATYTQGSSNLCAIYFITISSCIIHLYKLVMPMNKQNVLVVSKTSIILCLYLQICQAENINPSNTFTIANGNEQIMTDPSDRRGQMYLSYRGPGEPNSGVQGPRCVRYTRNYIYMHSI